MWRKVNNSDLYFLFFSLRLMWKAILGPWVLEGKFKHGPSVGPVFALLRFHLLLCSPKSSRKIYSSLSLKGQDGPQQLSKTITHSCCLSVQPSSAAWAADVSVLVRTCPCHRRSSTETSAHHSGWQALYSNIQWFKRRKAGAGFLHQSVGNVVWPS